MATIRAKSELDSSGFHKGSEKMKKDVKGFSASLGKLKGVMAAAFSFAAVVGFAKAMVNAASSIEDLTIQFKVLFNDVGKAKARMEELKTFSASTPFQLEDIANASQQLLVFSEGVLGGTESLKRYEH